MTKNVKMTVDNLPRLLLAMKRLQAEVVMVGIPATAADRSRVAGEPADINNAGLAYLHENGSPAANIPARPFLRPGVKDAAPKIAARYKAAAKAALDGNVAALEAAHNDVGLIAEASVRSKINNGVFEPLAASTLAARKRKGRPRDKPLIDTGALRNAVTYVVAPRPPTKR